MGIIQERNVLTQVLLLNISLIYFNFCSSDSETNIFQYTHLVEKPRSSQREVHIIAYFNFNLVYSVRVQFFVMKRKVLISATRNAQHSWKDKTEGISASYYSYSSSALTVVNNGLLLHTVPDTTRKIMPVNSARRKISQMNCNTWRE